jgi:magnesium-transporting ATPase (P-type)
MDSLSEILEGVRNVWQNIDVAHLSLLSMYLAVIILSSTLVFFMVRYRGKTMLDIAFIFREIAFLLIIWRVLIYRYSGAYNIYFAIFTLIFIAIACLGILFFLIKERYFYPNKHEDEQQELQGKDTTSLG